MRKISHGASTQEQEHQRPLSIPEIMVAGGLSALPMMAVIIPTERIKCLLQVQTATSSSSSITNATASATTTSIKKQQQQQPQQQRYKGMIDCGTKIYKSGGMSSLYKGTMISFMRGTWYLFSKLVVTFYIDYNETDPNVKNSIPHTSFVWFLSYLVLHITQSKYTCKYKYRCTWISCVVRIYQIVAFVLNRLQLKRCKMSKTTFLTLLLFYLFHLSCAIPNVHIRPLIFQNKNKIKTRFGTYEVMKQYIVQWQGIDNPSELSPIAVMTAGGFAGMACWATMIVPDTLKSRIQTAPDGMYNGIVDVYSKMVQQEGYASLFKGFRPAMIRT